MEEHWKVHTQNDSWSLHKEIAIAEHTILHENWSEIERYFIHNVRA